MDWHGWVTLGAIAPMAVAFLRNIAGPDVILLGTLALLTTVGVIDHAEG